MVKWKIYLIILVTLVGGIAAASFTIAPYVPQLPAISGEPSRLGLDLQGGIH